MRTIILFEIILFIRLLVGVDSVLDKEQEKFIEELNEQRRAVAIGKNIKNMHMLKFSEKLAEKAKNVYFTDKNSGLHQDWRFFVIKSYENGVADLMKNYNTVRKRNAREVLGFDEDYSASDDDNDEEDEGKENDDSEEGDDEENEDTEEENNREDDEEERDEEKKDVKQEKKMNRNQYFDRVEHLVPLQTSIGCAKRNGSTQNENNSKLILCLLGPEGTLDSWNAQKGNCLNGYEYFEGLCEPKIASKPQNTVTTIKDSQDKEAVNSDEKQRTFITNLNEERRSVASQRGIKCMHKLIFNDTLAKMAETVNDRYAPGKFVNWRFITFSNYDVGVKKLQDSYQKWMKGQETKENTVRVKRGNPSASNQAHTEGLEHVVPLQKWIGCANRRKKTTLCLLGPEGTLNSWYEPKVKCSKGYKQDEGLCVPKVHDNPQEKATTTKEPENYQDEETTESFEKAPDSSSPLPSSNEKTKPIDQVTQQTSVTDDPSASKTTTTMSEVNKLIAKWRETETDGDDYDEDDRTTTEVFSSSNSCKMLLGVLLVLCSV